MTAWRDRQQGDPTTVNSRLRILRTLLSDVSDRYGLRNPSARVKCLRERRGKPKGMSPGDLATFLAKAHEIKAQWYPLFLTLAYTGCASAK